MSEAMQEPPTAPLSATDPRPVIRLPAAGPSNLIIIAGVLAAAGGLFYVLDSHRRQLSAPTVERPTRSTTTVFAPPPALELPAEFRTATEPPRPALAPSPLPVEAGARVFPSAPSSYPAQLPSFVDTGAASRIPDAPAPPSGSKDAALVADYGSGDDAAPGAPGGAGLSDTEPLPARASVIRGRATLVPQGTLISATLETPIDSTRPGMVRAIVARDVRGFDGSRILIPRGSRLIGDYKAEIQTGQRRVLATWSRLIRPDGVAIRIGSPATDPLGTGGIPGRVDNHFFSRFSAAVLQTALTIGTNLAAPAGSSSIVVGASNEISSSASQGLALPNDLRPTIKVRPGAVIGVFVARDLDFSGASPIR